MSNNVKLPSAGGSSIRGTSGSTRFSATITQTTNGGVQGYGRISGLTGASSSDQWILNMVKEAIEADSMVECIGRYEEHGVGLTSTNTDSVHAHWIKGSASVDCKVDYDITLNNTTGMYEVDIQLYAAENGWKCDYNKTTYATHTFAVEHYLDEGTDGGEDNYKLSCDGQPIIGNYVNGEDAYLEVKDAIDGKVQDAVDKANVGLTGWKTDITASGAPSKSQIDNMGDETKTFTVTLEGSYTNDTQVYSRMYTAYQPAEVKLYINKQIADGYEEFLSIPIYDLSDAEYKVYGYDNSYLGTITIPYGGIGTSTTPLKIPAKYANKTVYVDEVLPYDVIGYKDKNGVGSSPMVRDTLTAPGTTKYIYIENEPINDPVSIKIMKDSNLNNGNWIGEPDLSGIEYTLEYYTDDSCSGSPYREWTFETDSSGQINFASDDPISGDELFTRGSTTVYPVGWYMLYESTSESELHDRGLEKCPAIYYIEVTDDGSGGGKSTVYTNSSFTSKAGNTYLNGTNQARIYQKTGNTYGVIEREHWEPFAFAKKDIYLSSGRPEGDTELQNAVFTVYSSNSGVFNSSTTYDGDRYTVSGGVVHVNGSPVTITIDANGRGICPYPLPKKDCFYIREDTAPLGYKANNQTYYIDYDDRTTVYDYNGNRISLSVPNMEDNGYDTKSSVYSVSGGRVNNTPRSGSITIEKFDNYSDNRKEQGDGFLSGIKFAIVNRTPNYVDYNGVESAPNCVAYIATTNAEGKVRVDGLPYGTYDVYELSKDTSLRAGSTYSDSAAKASIYANDGYLLNDNNYLGRAVIHPSTDTEVVVRHFTIENAVVRADVQVVKKDNEITETQGDASLAGIRYAVVNASKKPVKIDGKNYAVGEVIYIIETNEAGVANIATDYGAGKSNSLPYGTYDIHELRLDSKVQVGKQYNTADKGTSIYANDHGYLYTENTTVAKSPTGDYSVAMRTKSPDPNKDTGGSGGFKNHILYTEEFTNVVSNAKEIIKMKYTTKEVRKKIVHLFYLRQTLRRAI